MENEELPVVKPKPESEKHVMEDTREAMQGNGDVGLQYCVIEILHRINISADKCSYAL